MAEQVEFFDLNDARAKIADAHEPIILINAPGTIRSLGILVIDKIFKILASEVNIAKMTLRVDDDIAGVFESIKLGYNNILYSGNSTSIKKLLEKYNQKL
jgi:hypothetical protein